MHYISTRGSAPVLTFEQAMLTGLARDGGLYVPETVPQFSPDEIAALASGAALRGTQQASLRVCWPSVLVDLSWPLCWRHACTAWVSARADS